MPEIQTVNNTTFEVTLVGGDKVEIGDKESTDFKPSIKLNRWDGECFIKIQPANLVEEEVEFEVEDDKVKCKYKVKYEDDTEEEFEAEFYPLEPTTIIAKDKDGNDVEFEQNELGGFEFEVILKQKPVTNKIVLDIETQELKFYYQPELTPEEIAEGCIRPDNVVGSYAVYHATRTNMHRGEEDAEKYKCGVAFHIYRPKITDAEGKWVWGELLLDEQAGTLTTIIPQDFLDSAIYPVSTGTTNFGYESVGGSNISNFPDDDAYGSLFTSPAIGGTGTRLTIRISPGSGGDWKGLLVLHTDLTIVDNGITDALYPSGGPPAWKQLPFSVPPTIEPTTEYLLMILGSLIGTFDRFYYTTGDASQGHEDTSNSFDSPQNLGSVIHDTKKFSIYCTYEEAAPPAGQPYISRVQGVQGMRSWGGI